MKSGSLATVTPITTREARQQKYTRLTPKANARLKEALLELQDEGACSKADYRRVAERFNVSVRTVERRLAELRHSAPLTGATQRHSSIVLPDDVLMSIASERQLHKVYRDLKREGRYQGSLATFYRQCTNKFGSRTLRGVTSDVNDMRRGTYEVLDRFLFMQGMSLDLFYLRAPLAGATQGTKAVGALVRELTHGLVVASWIWPTDQVTTSDVTTLLAEAFRGRMFEYDGQAVFVGGVPDFLRADNGGQFTSREIGDMLNPLGVRMITSNQNRSHENGAHETVHGLLRKELLQHFPGSEDAQRDHRGQLLPDPRPLVTLDEARELLDRWVWTFNTRDTGSGSRMDFWIEDIELSGGVLPNRETPEALARYAVERPLTAKLYKQGVLVDKNYYTCPQLEEKTHKRYLVRQWLRDRRTIEVFTPSGTYVGVASLNGELTAAEAGLLQQSAGEAEREVKAVVAAARAKQPRPLFPPVPELDQPTVHQGDQTSGGLPDLVTPLSGLTQALRQPVVPLEDEEPEGDAS